MFAGASGVGKTTSAKALEDNSCTYWTPDDAEFSIPFISGSVSDLLPKTKDMPHADMLSRDPKDLYMEDYQILNLRQKLFREQIEKSGNFVSDRSFLDSAAYFLYKQADKIPACEVESFLSLCKQLTNTYCTHLILFDFNVDMLHEWNTEDNGKRIKSNYFQMEITTIMKMVLDIWDISCLGLPISRLAGGGWFKPDNLLDYGAEKYIISSIYGKTKVLLCKEVDREIRNKLIWQFIHGKI